MNCIKFKPDDIVVAIPGFIDQDAPYKGLERGGTGYVEGKIYKVRIVGDFIEPYNGCIMWSVDNRGVWTDALRLAYPEEILAFEQGITNIKNIKYDEIY